MGRREGDAFRPELSGLRTGRGERRCLGGDAVYGRKATFFGAGVVLPGAVGIAKARPGAGWKRRCSGTNASAAALAMRPRAC